MQTRLDLHPYVWLRDPEVFPEPERVILERWNKPPQHETQAFHPIINTPFSTGPRTCIGELNLISSSNLFARPPLLIKLTLNLFYLEVLEIN